MDSTEIEKLEGADLPTLQEIEAILAGEGSEQTKADQVSAALGGM
jgi:hypothetical protein